ncbi:cytochrome P450 [Oxalobacteraceae bacterium]|nr:cytochrome P450 [Oxalobacteraceae bacterium]
MQPSDPIAAVVHDDPYPYYASLAARGALVFDEGLKLWIAASPASVRAVLAHADCRVRPLAEPVPAAIAGGPAGQVFGALLRMNEGAAHTQPKLALQRALAGVDLAQASALAASFMVDAVQAVKANAPAALAEPAAPSAGPALLARAMFQVPVSTVASLLGFPAATLSTLCEWMGDFVACLSPLSTPAQLEGAHAAARVLLDSFRALLRGAPAAAPDSLLALLLKEAHAVGWAQADGLLANLVGLLSQTYEASAGLIGNSVIAAHRQADGAAASAANAAALVAAVSRNDPPIQNTRRFVAQDCTVAGTPLRAGQAILVVLAAASRDPDAQGEVFGFGHGIHACPGHALACAIAVGALAPLLARPLPAPLAWRYRASVNARIPDFSHLGEAP